jgi:hypothetical protein
MVLRYLTLEQVVGFVLRSGVSFTTPLTSLIRKRNMVIYLLIKEGIVETKRIMGMIAVVSIMFLSYVTTTSAQHLMEDTVWFKMKVSVKGHSNTDPGEPVAPSGNTGTIYVRFSPTVNAWEHDWQLWSLNATTGIWDNYDSGTQHIFGETDGIVRGWSPTWNIGPAQFYDTVINGFMKIKRDGLVTKSAKFTTDGCSLLGLWQGQISGGCKLTGSLIKLEKLPF